MILGSGMTSSRARLRLIEQLRDDGIKNEEVLNAMSEVPRHIFVDSGISHRAYENIALPIGWKQTISQPYTVARITEITLNGLTKIGGSFNKVLEIGCGCGYQSAILSYLFKQVYAVERIAPLLEKAKQNIKQLNINNIKLAHRDGNMGWKEEQYFDAIIISAATDKIPEELSKQISYKGCIVLPLGEEKSQQLKFVTFNNGKAEISSYDGVLFVPLLEGTE